MGCNYDITKVNKLFNLAVQYYPKKKLAHALRVAEYATAKADLLKLDTTKAYMIALAHDLLEDTDCPKEDLMSTLGIESYNSVVLLTKDPQEKYEDYIHKILDAKDDYAFIVKQADMKDHMTLTDTLTEKLRDKYIPILHYFL